MPVSTGRGSQFLKSIEFAVIFANGLDGFVGSIDSLISENRTDVRLDKF